jgi:hypothetical protein
MSRRVARLGGLSRGAHHRRLVGIDTATRVCLMIRLRFVAGKDDISLAIILRSQVCMPFTPSHVESVRPDGKYVGQHFSGGMQARDPGYDKAIMSHELFVDLPASPEQNDAFYAFIDSKIGQPYDWKSIIDYALPVDLHIFNDAICSATVELGLRATPAGQMASAFKPWLRWPVTVPAHLISPRDLLLMLSCLVEIPH